MPCFHWYLVPCWVLMTWIWSTSLSLVLVPLLSALSFLGSLYYGLTTTLLQWMEKPLLRTWLTSGITPSHWPCMSFFSLIPSVLHIRGELITQGYRGSNISNATRVPHILRLSLVWITADGAYLDCISIIYIRRFSIQIVIAQITLPQRLHTLFRSTLPICFCTNLSQSY